MNDKQPNADKPYQFQPEPIWSNFAYLFSFVGILCIPLFFPEVSATTWIIIVFGITITFYILVCLLGIWKSLFAYKKQSRR
ncbi:MAG: hypothetical protein OEY78_09505 [Gammaproteobacteria bacterium]|nr:hypothetical protein [Gammaproteobacteria bacterium]